MGKVECHVIRCANCGTYQVQQVKKNNNFKCTMCGTRQKLLEEHFRGHAKQCREIVQHLNKAYHTGEIRFTPATKALPDEPEASLCKKRKPMTKSVANVTTRAKKRNQTKSESNGIENKNTDKSKGDERGTRSFERSESDEIASNSKTHEEGVEHDDLFSFESPQKSRNVSNERISRKTASSISEKTNLSGQ